MQKELPQIQISKAKLRRRTIISFCVFLVFCAFCVVSWKWLVREPLQSVTPAPLRKNLVMNENIFSKIFSTNNKVKTYPVSAAAKQVRRNGNVGMTSALDTSTFRLQLIRMPGDTQYISMAELRALPKTEIIFDFKCIEGWSQVTHWGGVKFSDFALRYGLTDQVKMKYCGLHTPDNAYYVGIDNPSMMHSQTILCYEMNGMPLPMADGAPLRLIIPVKYGVKHLKRLSTMFFSNERPRDYWYERGYDYYCGL